MVRITPHVADPVESYVDCEFYRVGSDVESNCSGDSVVSVVCLAL